MKTTVDVTSL